jgi:WD40 repeat protein
VEQFDNSCNNLFTRLGEIKADRVDAIGRFSRMPIRREPLTLDLPALNPLPQSLSASNILDFPIRSLSFGSNLPRIVDHSIWQVRPYTDAKIAPFECSTLTPSLAAMAYVPVGGSQRTLAVTRYADRPSTWVAHALPIRNVVESMAADAHFAYLLTADRIFLVPLTRDGRAESAVIPPSPSGRIVAPFMEGAIAAFDGSSQLVYVTAALTVKPIATQYRGVVSIAPIDGRLICGVSGSTVVRLLAPDGREARGFIGHVAPVTRVARLSDQLFASSGEDATVRVWDLRERFPVVSVITNGVAVLNVAGSSDYLVAGMRNREINVFDLRNTAGKPVLGVTTQEYDPINLHYNQNEDLLAMFGAVEKEGTRNSMMFVDGEGQSRQRIFRIYREFVGVDTR